MSDVGRSYEALRNGVALVEPRPGDWLRITGDDRLRFANGLVSCDLRALGAGAGAYGFFTDPKGRVIADAAFLAGASELWVELPEGLGEQIAEHMRRFLVADRVEIQVLDAFRAVVVAGPGARRQLEPFLAETAAVEPWHGSVDHEASGGPVLLRGERRLGVSGWVIAGGAEALTPAIERLRAAGVRAAVEPAVQAVRIEQGVAWFGPDFGPNAEGGGSFPQETGLESWAVSFEKGCYLGQEVIARIHFRGKVNRSLRGLVFEKGAAIASGARLLAGGDAVGVVNSSAESPLMGRPIGLAIVHHKAAIGAELATDAGDPCRLVELPFDRAAT